MTKKKFNIVLKCVTWWIFWKHHCEKKNTKSLASQTNEPSACWALDCNLTLKDWCYVKLWGTVSCCCPQLWPPGVSDIGHSWCWTGTLLYPVSLLFGCWDRWSAQKLTIPRSSDWWLKCWRTGWALELWSLKCWPPEHGWKTRKGRKAGFLLTKEKYLTGRYVAV